MFGRFFKTTRSKTWFWQVFTTLFYAGLSWRFAGGDASIAFFFCLLFTQLVYQKHLRPVDFRSVRNRLARRFLLRIFSQWATGLVMFALVTASLTLCMLFLSSSGAIAVQVDLILMMAAAILMLPLQLLFDYGVLWRMLSLAAGFDEERFIGFYMRASIFVAGYVVLAGNQLPELIFLPLIRVPYLLLLVSGDFDAFLDGDDHLWLFVFSFLASALFILFYHTEKILSRSNNWLIRQVTRWGAESDSVPWLEQRFNSCFRTAKLDELTIIQKAKFMARYSASLEPSVHILSWSQKYLGSRDIEERN